MVQPRFPGVGTQSRVADVQIAQSRLSQQQEESNRRSGLALLGLLSRTGIDIGQLIQQSREAGAQREFATSEREGAQGFRAGEAALDRTARADELGADRRFATLEREAGQGFTTGRDEALAKQAATAATTRFKRDQQLANEARQRLPAERADQALREVIQAVTEGLIAKREAGQPVDSAAEQETITQAVLLFVRNTPEARNSPIARPFLERQTREAEVQQRQQVTDPFGFQAEQAATVERDRPRLEANQRAAERRLRVREINKRFQQGDLNRSQAERLLEAIGRPFQLDLQAVQPPQPSLSRQPNIFP